MVRIDSIDPRDHTGTICEINTVAWSPPCIVYDEEYVRWQFDFPGDRSPVGVIAYYNGEAFGCYAAMPRRMRIGSHVATYYLQSFLAMKPGFESHRLSMKRSICAMLRTTDAPIITFCRTGSRAERLMLAGCKHCRLIVKKICDLPLHGFSSDVTCPPKLSIEAPATPESFLVAARALQTDPCTLWHEMDVAALRHYNTDARCSTPVVVRDLDGSPAAAAILLRAGIRQPGGVITAPTLQNVCLAPNRPAALTALCCVARDSYRNCRHETVVIPNAWPLDEVTCRQARVRKLQGSYSAIMATSDPDHPGLSSRGTNLEIV